MHGNVYHYTTQYLVLCITELNYTMYDVVDYYITQCMVPVLLHYTK